MALSSWSLLPLTSNNILPSPPSHPMSLPPLPLHTSLSQAFSLSSLVHFTVLISYLLLPPHPMDLPSDKVIHPPLQTDCQC